jgi:hypothetical protein
VAHVGELDEARLQLGGLVLNPSFKHPSAFALTPQATIRCISRDASASMTPAVGRRAEGCRSSLTNGPSPHWLHRWHWGVRLSDSTDITRRLVAVFAQT